MILSTLLLLKTSIKKLNCVHFWSILEPQISWHCKFIDSSYNIEFSIGIGRYPDNGKDLDLIKKKKSKKQLIWHVLKEATDI